MMIQSTTTEDHDAPTTAFLLLGVRAQNSGNVVRLLKRNYPQVAEAAAVYAETDVVARISAPRKDVAAFLLRIYGGDIDGHGAEPPVKYHLDAIQLLVVAQMHPRMGPPRNSEGPNDLLAYVIVDLRQEVVRSETVAELLDCDGVAYVAALTMNHRVLIKVHARSKAEFDRRIMIEIQGKSGVAATRTLLVINEDYFVRKAS